MKIKSNHKIPDLSEVKERVCEEHHSDLYILSNIHKQTIATSTAKTTQCPFDDQ